MQLTLQENELHEIIRNHVAALITLNEGTSLDVSIKALRGTEGFTAVVDILNEGENQPKAVVPRRATRKPAASQKDEPQQKDPEPEVKQPEPAQEGAQLTQEAPVTKEDTEGTTITDQAGTADSVKKMAEVVEENQPEQSTNGGTNTNFDPEAEEAALKEQVATPKSNGTQNQDMGAKPATVATTTGTRPVFPGFKGLKRPGA